MFADFDFSYDEDESRESVRRLLCELSLLSTLLEDDIQVLINYLNYYLLYSNIYYCQANHKKIKIKSYQNPKISC